MINQVYLQVMTTSTIDMMNSLSQDLAAFQLNDTKINDFIELVKDGPVSPIALEVLADRSEARVVRVRAFARVSADLRKAS